MTITVFISVTAHLVGADSYNYLLLVYILHSLCLYKTPSWSWFFTWWDESKLHF